MTTKRALPLNAVWKNASPPQGLLDAEAGRGRTGSGSWKKFIEHGVVHRSAHLFRIQLLRGKHLVGAIHAIDYRERPLPDFVINATQIFPENPNTEERQAGHEENGGEEAV